MDDNECHVHCDQAPNPPTFNISEGIRGSHWYIITFYLYVAWVLASLKIVVKNVWFSFYHEGKWMASG